jgi:hypothetical protein
MLLPGASKTNQAQDPRSKAPGNPSGGEEEEIAPKSGARTEKWKSPPNLHGVAQRGSKNPFSLHTDQRDLTTNRQALSTGECLPPPELPGRKKEICWRDLGGETTGAGFTGA